MHVNTREFIHEVATTRKATLIFDRVAGKITLRIDNATDETMYIITTPAVGRFTSEQYDITHGDVIRVAQTINAHFSNITVIYVE